MNWQFLNTGLSSGRVNMDRDEDLARQLADGTGNPTVRVYGWNPPAISLGWNQSWDEVRMDAAEAAGIDVVRRPTGGRAILHENEATYSVVMSSRGENVSEAYARISLALTEALRLLGVNAALERSQPHFPSLYRKGESAACFVSSARSEIMVKGRKLVGSAQRRYAVPGGEVVLQHGSILLGPEHRRLARYLRLRPEQEVHLSEQLAVKTTDLRHELQRDVSLEEVASRLKDGFEKTWNIRFIMESASVSHIAE